MVADRLAGFRNRCVESGLALTHQRMVIFEAIASSTQHPTPEMVYEAVREKIPSISLATVYKSIHTFASLGLLREVTQFETQRWDANLDPHHHLVCTRCKAVIDLPVEALSPVELRDAGTAPPGFRVHGFKIEVLGLCSACASDPIGE